MAIIEVGLDTQGFEQSSKYVEDVLNANQVSSELINETMLVYEALFHNLQEQSVAVSGKLDISSRVRLGDVRINLGFEGNIFDPLDDEGDPFAPENKIISAYADKIDHSYHSGYNKISISVRRSYGRTMISCMAAILIAIALYIPIHFFADSDQQYFLLEELFYPLEELFSNAILMIAAPVTFLSLIKNLTDVYILSERNSEVRRLQRVTIATSVMAIIMAIGMSILITEMFTQSRGVIRGSRLVLSGGSSLGNIISSIIPSNIFEPFISISPIPLLILSVLFTYAFCSVGKYFDTLKAAVDEGYVLCSRILGILMSTIPFFTFAAVEDLLLSFGFRVIVGLATLILLVCASLIVMVLFYAVILQSEGVQVRPFVKKLTPLISENLKINSGIDAVPFNVRYCGRVFGANRKKLEVSLSVLAQINLDGNCYVLMLLALLLVFASGTSLSPAGIALVGALVLFLSLGAPNQPGSGVIGLGIILTYLNAEELLPVAICAEVFFGGLINIINVIGDIVIVAKEEHFLTDLDNNSL